MPHILPGMPHGTVTKALSAQWSTVKKIRAQKQQQQAEREQAPPSTGGSPGAIPQLGGFPHPGPCMKHPAPGPACMVLGVALRCWLQCYRGLKEGLVCFLNIVVTAISPRAAMQVGDVEQHHSPAPLTFSVLHRPAMFSS